jgi:uncharacterized pyridoxal phosphate-containing UPF0001 family protein
LGIAENLARVRESIDRVCARAGRRADSVKLLAVSKAQPIEAVIAAFAAGQDAFGENYAQELHEKADALPEAAWHFLPEQLDELLAAVRELDSLRCEGLMCIPPAEQDPRPHFRALRELRERLGLRELSMGMSADYQIAIEEGSTIVRVGTAIFGERPARGG